jgi:hypothetical protein
MISVSICKANFGVAGNGAAEVTTRVVAPDVIVPFRVVVPKLTMRCGFGIRSSYAGRIIGSRRGTDATTGGGAGVAVGAGVGAIVALGAVVGIGEGCGGFVGWGFRAARAVAPETRASPPPARNARRVIGCIG